MKIDKIEGKNVITIEDVNNLLSTTDRITTADQQGYRRTKLHYKKSVSKQYLLNTLSQDSKACNLF